MIDDGEGRLFLSTGRIQGMIILVHGTESIPAVAMFSPVCVELAIPGLGECPLSSEDVLQFP
jgi:hypothetical protein